MSIRWGKMINNLAEVETAASAGFTHVQLPVETIMRLNQESFQRCKDRFCELGIVPEVCSSPLPDDVRVTEMGFNIYVWTEYLKKAVRRLKDMGCAKLVWSNGRSRVVPWEGDVAGVKEQVLQFLYLLADMADEHNIMVLVEPLGPRRTNFLNSMKEMRDFLERAGKENLASVLSLRELDEIGFSLEELEGHADFIKHIHLENPGVQEGERRSPSRQDGADYQPFVAELKRVGYSEMICLPGDADTQSLQYCKGLWEK